jgi:PfaB family protein
MPDLSAYFDLSIIGMEIVGSDISGLDTFGFQLFRGLKASISPVQKNLLADDLKKVITNTIQKAGMNFDSVGVVTFQSGIKEKIDDFEFEITSKEADGQKDHYASAWHTAADWLDSGEIEAVLILEYSQEDQFYSAVLVSTSQFAVNNAKQVLAVVSGITERDESVKDISLETLLNSALKSGNIQSNAVGLILASASLESASEILSPQALISIFPSNNSFCCALSGGFSGLVSVIKAVWCLHNRVIPGTSEWKSPANPQEWTNSIFYIPKESRTWFNSASQPTRFAVTINSNRGETSSVFLIQEGQSTGIRINAALQQETFYLFPSRGSTLFELIHRLEILKGDLARTPDLRIFCNENLKSWQAGLQPDDLIACILGHTREELSREVDFALKGIPAAVEKNSDWRTPMGSYMTPEPLGRDGQVSFVYPGAFNSYPGVGRDLFYLFPALYDRLAAISSNLSDLLNEKKLYPRSISALSSNDLEVVEKSLSDDPLAMLISGTSLAAVFTFLLRDVFEIHPASAFGYSLGEISMMFASGAWTEADKTSAALRASPLFHTRLAGQQNAIRESWNLPIVSHYDPDNVIFSNFVLMAEPETVNSVIKNENRVFMTHINTPRQVVIAGDPAACHVVIETLKCNSLQAPFNYALHCEAMQSEYPDLQSLLSWPVANQPDMTLYSAADYQAMPIEQNAIAHQIAYGLCHQLDFPRLVNQAFSDGARIFIELGAGSNCSRWVDESLKDKPHAAFSINRKGLDDHAAVLQLLAKLISHHVQLNLSALLS